jgi:hypothetical protein
LIQLIEKENIMKPVKIPLIALVIGGISILAACGGGGGGVAASSSPTTSATSQNATAGTVGVVVATVL